MGTESFPKGSDLLHNPILNKGTAFTLKERKVLELEGLLPPHIFTQDEQKLKALSTVRGKETNLEKYIYLLSLQDRNETLFYRLVIDEIEELMPIIYTPTVGTACQNFGQIFRRPRGLYISSNDKGSIDNLLYNWPYKNIDIIVVTDGERILGLGDLGADGMGIPIGKLTLYTACAGINPDKTLPITIDVGTNNEKLLSDPLYIGLRNKRMIGNKYDKLIDEFMYSVTKRFPKCLIQFEDFANQNAHRLLKKYRHSYCTFNDDIQGTGSVILAGILSVMRFLEQSLENQNILFYGAGTAAFGIAEIIVKKMMLLGMSMDDARHRICFFDSKGLVVQGRRNLNNKKKLYAHNIIGETSLGNVIERDKSSILIGVSGKPNAFDKSIIQKMAKVNNRPIIFALSNPTSKSECTAEQAYSWTDGRAIFASGSPFKPVSWKRKTFYPGQGNNAYIFPGVGLGIVVSKALYVTDEMFIVAAETLSDMVTKDDMERGQLYPSLNKIRDISLKIAVNVANVAFNTKISSIPKPNNLEKYVKCSMFEPTYRNYV